MAALYLTAYNGAILGPIAKFLGWLMNGIYVGMNQLFGIRSVAVAIILFTIIIYMAFFPLTWRQQKFSILSQKMQPELTAIQKKYNGKKDQQSMMAMQEETQKVYDKYGISPTGSCLQLLIQMPIFFALYRVFYNVPAYLGGIKAIFTDLVNGIVSTDGFAKTMQSVYETAKLSGVQVDFSSTDTSALKNYTVDVLYKLSDAGWKGLSDSFPNLTDQINTTYTNLKAVNYLGILNISDTPWNIIKTAFAAGAIGLVICAILVPVISYVTQVINIKLMPTSGNNNDQMTRQMKTMNMMMPLMSLVIAFTVPVGLSLYWIAGSVTRTVQLVFLNRHFAKMDLDAIIEKNKEKAEEKAEKRGYKREQILAAGQISTKRVSMADKAGVSEEVQAELDALTEARKNAPEGSMTAKANMVAEFNNRNTKK